MSDPDDKPVSFDGFQFDWSAIIDSEGALRHNDLNFTDGDGNPVNTDNDSRYWTPDGKGFKTTGEVDK